MLLRRGSDSIDPFSKPRVRNPEGHVSTRFSDPPGRQLVPIALVKAVCCPGGLENPAWSRPSGTGLEHLCSQPRVNHWGTFTICRSTSSSAREAAVFHQIAFQHDHICATVAFPRWNMIAVWVMISADVCTHQDSENQPLSGSLATSFALDHAISMPLASFVNAYLLLLDYMVVTNKMKSLKIK